MQNPISNYPISSQPSPPTHSLGCSKWQGVALIVTGVILILFAAAYLFVIVQSSPNAIGTIGLKEWIFLGSTIVLGLGFAIGGIIWQVKACKNEDESTQSKTVLTKD